MAEATFAQAESRHAALSDLLADREEARDLWAAGIASQAHPRILARLAAAFHRAADAFGDDEEAELLELDEALGL